MMINNIICFDNIWKSIILALINMLFVMELKKGTILQNGKYKICQTLGRGGFAYTYLAEHCMVHEKVAIKELFSISVLV